MRAFSSMHPATCFCYYLGVLLLSMILFHPLFLVTALLVLVLLNYCQDKGQQLKALLPYYLFLFFLIVLINPLLNRRGATILFYLLDRQITLEAVIYGLCMALSLMVILISFSSYQKVITPDKFLFLFSSPAPQLALLTLLSLRFLPLLIRRYHQISLVQSTRGIQLETAPVRKRLSDLMLLFSILTSLALEEALQTADSIRGRGYGVGKRSSYYPQQLSKKDRLTLTSMFLAVSVCLIGRFLGYGSFTCFPHLEKISWTKIYYLFYGIYLFLLLMPFLVEGEDRLRWHLSRLTI